MCRLIVPGGIDCRIVGRQTKGAEYFRWAHQVDRGNYGEAVYELNLDGIMPVRCLTIVGEQRGRPRNTMGYVQGKPKLIFFYCDNYLMILRWGILILILNLKVKL